MVELNQVLSAREESLTRRLKDKIIAAIGGHSIPVSRYIEYALYEPRDGYYNNLLHKFGKAGDFVTAPVVSGLFALCLARQIDELWQESPVMRNILEIGAGNGQLMIDLLHTLGKVINCYYVLEISASLVHYQKQRIEEKYPELMGKIIWLDKLPAEFDGIILANEVLDAQPAEVVVWNNGEIKQRVVKINKEGDFIYANKAIKSKELFTLATTLGIKENHYISEINLNNRGFIKSLAESLTSGFILLIDYGYPQREFYLPSRVSGTLRGFFHHQLLDDILVYPGLIDITSSVDFSAIAVTGIENNLDFIGYTSQANFLFNCGLLDIIESQHGVITDIQYLKLTKQLNFLTSINEMGELFKVIGFSKNIDFGDWVGFSDKDRSNTL